MIKGGFMKRAATALVILALTTGTAAAASQCPAGYSVQHSIEPHSETAFGPESGQGAGGCSVQMRNGFPVPDPNCTPGAFNPTITLEILQDPKFRTGCIRDKATTPQEKSQTYSWYDIKHPSNNQGATQVYELDHFVPLELGGADTLDNIWPQCGPSRVALANRYFKQKDLVENYLASMVRANKADLDQARKCITADWTQFLDQARAVCHGTRCEVSEEQNLDLTGCGG